jgi:transposase-like protein
MGLPISSNEPFAATNLNTLLAYLEGIRKAIYNPNAIASLNSLIRKATQKRKLFPMMMRPERWFIWR